MLIQKAKKYKQKYKTQVLGEVIGHEKKERIDWVLWILRILAAVQNPIHWREKYKYTVYSPTIKYEVQGNVYEVNARDYERCMPIVGRKAFVVYCDWNPGDACVWTQRKYRKPIKIQKRDEEYIYCAYGLKKNIRIPLAEVEGRAVPGRFLVHKYGFYHLLQPEEIKKTFVEMMENPLMEKRDEYK